MAGQRKHRIALVGAVALAAVGLAAPQTPSAVAAAPPEPVVLDINQTSKAGAPTIPESAELGGFTYFAGRDNQHGREVWRTDGTPAGTTRVTDVNAHGSSDPRYFTTVDGSVYFIATDGDRYGLWRTDHSKDGARLVRSVGAALGGYGHLTRVGKRLYFAGRNKAHGTALWVSKGTRASTHVVATMGKSPHTHIVDVASAKGLVCFVAGELGAGGWELWTPNNSKSGARKLTDSTSVSSLITFGDRCYFTLNPKGPTKKQLWITDGTHAGTTRAAAFPPASWDVSKAGLRYLTNHDNGAVLRVIKTPGGTPKRVTDFPGWDAGYRYDMTSAAGRTYFTLSNLSQWHPNGPPGQLWMTDGTRGGTTRITFPPTVPLPSELEEQLDGYPRNLLAVGDLVFFEQLDGTGVEVWRTDGTPDGTSSLGDLNTDPLHGNGSSPLIGAVGDQVLLTAADERGLEPWISDGTPAGTMILGDLDTRTHRSLPGAAVAKLGVSEKSAPPVVMDGSGYFRADDGIHGMELWRTDGTPAGTELVHDITPGPLGTALGDLRAVGSRVFFTIPSAHGLGLWATDGTPSGLLKLSDAGYLWEFADLGEHLAFTKSNELWISDGTPTGTYQLAPEYAKNLRTAGGVLYFAAGSPTDVEPWVSDGTAGGTHQLAEIRPGAEGSDPAGFTEFDGWVYFFADDGVNGRQLWRTDGTGAGTTLFKHLSDSPEAKPRSLTATTSLLFLTVTGTKGRELWASDGTSTGTSRLRGTKDGTGFAYPRGLYATGDRLTFAVTDPGGYSLWRTTGTADGLWKSNGTAAGTKELVGTTAFNLTVVGDELYYTTDAAKSEPQLWRTDGHAAGTVPVVTLTFHKSLAPDYPLPNPAQVGSHLVYGGYDKQYGGEPHVLPMP